MGSWGRFPVPIMGFVEACTLHPPLESPMGRSLIGGLGNNFSNLPSTSSEITCSSFLSQQQRTFIQMRTVLKVVDNSGAKKVMCIQALKGKKGARLGDTIIASVKEAMPNGKVVAMGQGQPIGTRVFGPVPHELRQKKHVKILTLAEHIA
ncbi:hypothetical protein PVK06_033462 [Gossypium arboreum]|uniref:50S ribosomal protein L14 n=1 Tax=Gossypium arboreum TaxID=29729 RepID=A0ABR0NED4_GOSAR|nr:hypothetical protein PVK06_033462 [Gossypium arboreum]